MASGHAQLVGKPAPDLHGAGWLVAPVPWQAQASEVQCGPCDVDRSSGQASRFVRALYRRGCPAILGCCLSTTGIRHMPGA